MTEILMGFLITFFSLIIGWILGRLGSKNASDEVYEIINEYHSGKSTNHQLKAPMEKDFNYLFGNSETGRLNPYNEPRPPSKTYSPPTSSNEEFNKLYEPE